MSKWKTTTVISLLIALIPLGLYWYLYPQMPEMVPIHFDWQGRADRFVEKSSLEVPLLAGLGLIGLAVIKVSFALTLRFGGQQTKDNGRAAAKNASLSVLGCTVLFAVISVHALIVQTGTIAFSGLVMVRITMVILGLLMLITGNQMPKLRRNSLAGLRLKETLADDRSWFRGQRFAGRCYVAGGILLLAGVLLPGWWALYAGIAFFALANIIPVVYVKKVLNNE
ncbi:SdpI family protein [Paenibacillus tengchongensis]|uniref:SdpI family protein n=1 Tax=Paenibacillus tengchongensis TaxID=2608684 RepID=UPI00124F6AD4|nr:SdpI family protein [Paenibacillus tengchongensis]